MAWLWLFVAILLEVVATTALKASKSFTQLAPSVVVVVGYAAAFYCMSIPLMKLPMGIVYAVWSGLGIVVIALVGLVRYREVLDLPALIGMGLILAGVFVITLLSTSVAQH
ncbi:MAG: multidrug efflux SMR transporter [Hyphomicrobium sp.]|uniref:DMT family transporter n=1 Tax=Hyphomicrobium sp. TaxID=82 RepID=UPI003D10A3DA